MLAKVAWVGKGMVIRVCMRRLGETMRKDASLQGTSADKQCEAFPSIDPAGSTLEEVLTVLTKNGYSSGRASSPKTRKIRRDAKRS